MTVYTVTVFLNVSDGNFFGYKPEHTLADAGVELEVAGSTPEAAAGVAFEIGNRVGSDLNLTTWPSDIRSVSVGDLVRVKETFGAGRLTFFSVDSFGWTEVPEPTNPRRPLVGTRATSRRS